MGQEQSAQARAHHAEVPAAAAGDAPSLWEGVPEPVLWLVKEQVRQLLTNHSSALLHRPEALTVHDDDDDGEDAGQQHSGRGRMQPHETSLAHAALRDKTIGPRVQRVLDRLVPTHVSEATFWDNFFSHLDVLKVRLVTDFLTAQDTARAELARKHESWVELFDCLDADMQGDLRRAAERIAARQRPPASTAAELAYGLDSQRQPRWTPDGEAWLEYVEDGARSTLGGTVGYGRPPPLPHESLRTPAGTCHALRSAAAPYSSDCAPYGASEDTHAPRRCLRGVVSACATCAYTCVCVSCVQWCPRCAGPHEVAKVLRATLEARGVLEPQLASPRANAGEVPLWRSPDQHGRHTLATRPLESAASAPATTSATETAEPTQTQPPHRHDQSSGAEGEAGGTDAADEAAAVPRDSGRMESPAKADLPEPSTPADAVTAP